MALLDFAVDNYFKFFFAVPGFALNAQAAANRVFVPFYRHLVSAVGTAYFIRFGFCGFHLSNSFQKILAIFTIIAYDIDIVNYIFKEMLAMTDKTRAKCEYWMTLYEKGYATLHKAKPEQYSGKNEDDFDFNVFQDENGKYLYGEYNIQPEQIELINKLKIENHLKIIKIIIAAGFLISVVSSIILGIAIAP